MRDPEGRLRLDGAAAIRELTGPGNATAFLHHPVAAELVQRGELVPFEWESPHRLVSPRYAFVSQPTDWCDAQFLAAARLTLDVAGHALRAGFELKDASAWNVIFDGTRPVFCDHLSFEPLARRQWWAFGQFCRHFTFPLAAARLRGMHAREVFLAHRDGLGVDQAAALFGTRGWASRLLPLLMQARSTSADSTRDDPAPAHPLAATDVLHANVLEYARRSLYPPRQSTTAAPWTRYVAERGHYSDAASQTKLAIVRQRLSSLAPGTVLDLGCNTGEFSRAALETGARVIAVDADHDSVQTLFRTAGGHPRLHPVVANLADLHGGRGWNATEHAGLAERLGGAADLVLMLALTHHLHFSESISLDDIAAYASRMTTAHLVLELLPETDPMVRQLARQRRRTTQTFAVERQLQAFGRHFDLVERIALPESGRELSVWRRRP